MKMHHATVSVGELCQLLGLSRQAYYKYYGKLDSLVATHYTVIDKVLRLRMHQPKLNGRGLFNLLKADFEAEGISIGRDAFFDLLSSHNLLAKNRQREAPVRQSKHWYRKYPNLAESYRPVQANRLWLTDIMYWRWQGTSYCLTIISDAYTLQVVGYQVAEQLNALYSFRTLQMAIDTAEADLSGLIHHTKGGIPYCSYEYVELLKRHRIRASMNRPGEPFDHTVTHRLGDSLRQVVAHNNLEGRPVKLAHVLKKAVDAYNSVYGHKPS